MKLKFNEVYSVKELREIFSLPNKNGAMAMQQIKNLEKEYELKKVKRGFYKIVRELSPEEKIETKVYDKNRSFIEPMIYEMLMNSKNNSIIKDMHELMEETEIVNKDFNYIKWHIKETADIINQSEIGLQIFTKESEPMLKKIIRDVLYDMQDRQLVKVIEIPVIAYKVYNSENKIWYTRRQDIISETDIQKLLETKRKILKELGLKKESNLKYHERSHFRDLIAKEYSGSYFYYKYNIIINHKGLQDLENYDIIKLKHKFNNSIQEKLKKSKQGGLKDLTKEEKDIYIKYCIDTSKDYKLRYRKEKKYE